MKLKVQHLHILNLIDRDKDADGWATVSESLCQHVSENIPSELVLFEKLDVGGRARLTEEGETVLDVKKKWFTEGV